MVTYLLFNSREWFRYSIYHRTMYQIWLNSNHSMLFKKMILSLLLRSQLSTKTKVVLPCNWPTITVTGIFFLFFDDSNSPFWFSLDWNLYCELFRISMNNFFFFQEKRQQKKYLLDKNLINCLVYIDSPIPFAMYKSKFFSKITQNNLLLVLFKLFWVNAQFLE